MNSDTLVQLLRYLIAIVGSWFVSRGLLTGDQVGQFVGAIAVIVPIVWGLAVKWHTRAVHESDLPVTVPTVSGVTGAKKP